MTADGRLTKKRKALLSDCGRLARRAGLRVSSTRLTFAGLRLKGGRCSLRDEPWLVVDRFLPYEDQLELYRRALSGVILDDAAFKGLSPDLREALALPAFKGEDGRSGPAPDEGEKTSFGVESSALEAETGVATRRSVSDLIDSPASGRVAFAEAEETLGSGD